MLLHWAGMPKLELTLPQPSCRKEAHLSCYMAGRILRPTPLQLQPYVTVGLSLLVAMKRFAFLQDTKIPFNYKRAQELGATLQASGKCLVAALSI